MDRTTLLLILLVAVIFLISQRFTGAEARSRKLRNSRKRILELKADLRNESNPVKKKSIDAEIVFLENYVEELTIELGFSNGDEYSIKESLKLAKAEFEKAKEVLNDFEKLEKDERERLAKEHTDREKELLSKARLLEKQELEERKRAARATKEYARKKAREDRELARKEAALKKKTLFEDKNNDNLVAKKSFLSRFKKSKVELNAAIKPEIDSKKSAKENRKLARERREEELRIRKEQKAKQRAERKLKGVASLEASEEVFESEGVVEQENRESSSLAYTVSDITKTTIATEDKADHFLEFTEVEVDVEEFTAPADLYNLPVTEKEVPAFTTSEDTESEEVFLVDSKEQVNLPKKKKSIFSSLFPKKEYASIAIEPVEVNIDNTAKKRKGFFKKKVKDVEDAVNVKWSIDDVDLSSGEGGSIVSIDESTLESNLNEVTSEQFNVVDANLSLNHIDDTDANTSTSFTEAHLESEAFESEALVEDSDVPRSFYEEVVESGSEGEVIGMERTLIELSDEDLSRIHTSNDSIPTIAVDLNSYDNVESVRNETKTENVADLRKREDKDERKRLREEEKQARLEAKRAELDAKRLERELNEKSKQEESILVAQAKVAERARIQEERLAEERAKAAAKAAMELIKNEERLEKAKADAAAREAKRLARREKFNKKFEAKKAKALEKAKVEEVKKAERIANAQKKIEDKKVEIALKEKERAEKAEIQRLSHAAKVEAKRAQAQLNREEAQNRAADRAEAEKRRNEERKLRRLTAVKRSEELEQRRIQRKAEKFGLVSTAIERKPVEKVGYTWDTESGYSYELSDAKRNASSAFEFRKYDLPEDLPRG